MYFSFWHFFYLCNFLSSSLYIKGHFWNYKVQLLLQPTKTSLHCWNQAEHTHLQHIQWCRSAQYLCNLDKMRWKKYLFSFIHPATALLSYRILSTVWPGTVSSVMSAIPKGQVCALKWCHIYKHCIQGSTSETLDSESACCNVCRLGVGG